MSRDTINSKKWVWPVAIYKQCGLHPMLTWENGENIGHMCVCVCVNVSCVEWYVVQCGTVCCPVWNGMLSSVEWYIVRGVVVE